MGDNTHKELANFPWHADEQKLMYPFYEKIARIRHSQCLHPQKGCSLRQWNKRFPRLRPYADCPISAPRRGDLFTTELPRLPL